MSMSQDYVGAHVVVRANTPGLDPIKATQALQQAIERSGFTLVRLTAEPKLTPAGVGGIVEILPSWDEAVTRETRLQAERNRGRRKSPPPPTAPVQAAPPPPPLIAGVPSLNTGTTPPPPALL